MVVMLVFCTQAGTWNFSGAPGASDAGDLQQICPVQSELSLQLLGQLAAQTPWQQMAAVNEPLQSDDVVHDLGHWVIAPVVDVDSGLRQMPLLRLGSIRFAVVQQSAPDVVSQSLEVAQALGHWSAVVQMPAPTGVL
jgi:hypothetical protein